MMAAWGEWVIVIPMTQQEIEEHCIHVWRDTKEDENSIIQECIRCKKIRTFNL